MSRSVPRPPKRLTPRARRLWRDLHTKFVFDASEAELVTELVWITATIDRLRAQVQAEGETVRGPGLVPMVHPAIREIRQQQITYARLRAALNLPAEEEELEARPRRRGGARGVYQLRSVI